MRAWYLEKCVCVSACVCVWTLESLHTDCCDKQTHLIPQAIPHFLIVKEGLGLDTGQKRTDLEKESGKDSGFHAASLGCPGRTGRGMRREPSGQCQGLTKMACEIWSWQLREEDRNIQQSKRRSSNSLISFTENNCKSLVYQHPQGSQFPCHPLQWAQCQQMRPPHWVLLRVRVLRLWFCGSISADSVQISLMDLFPWNWIWVKADFEQLPFLGL